MFLISLCRNEELHIKRIESFLSMKMEKKRKIFKQKKSLVSFTFTWCYIWIWWIVKNYYLNATLWRKYCQHSKFEGLNGSFFNPSNIHIGHSVIVKYTYFLKKMQQNSYTAIKGIFLRECTHKSPLFMQPLIKVRKFN